MKKQGFLYGSAVLMISAVAVKALGALFKIPLTNMLGGRGMGYFSAAYSIFMPIYAVSVTGLPAAAAKCTAEAMEKDGEAGAQTVKSIGLRLFGLVGLASFLVILTAAYPFCKYAVRDMYTFPAAAVIAPSVIAGCLMSVYRGYYEGRRNMYPTAVSQVVEGTVKLIAGLFFCWGTLFLARERPGAFLRLIGCENRHIDPMEAAVPYSAAAAVLGITLSSFGGLIWIFLYDLRQSRKKSPETVHMGSTGLSSGKIHENTCRRKRSEIRSELLKIALPAAVGALVVNLTSLIDLVTVMGSLKAMTEHSPETFEGLVKEGVKLTEIPNFIYGSFTGLAVTLFNLIPSLTNMFGKSMLPAAAAAKAAGDAKRLGECSRKGLLASALVAFPAGAGLTAMAEPLLRLLFGGRETEISVCLASMKVLGLAVPFVCISQTAFAILQAADRADIPVKLMGLGAAVKLVFNLLLTPVPGLGVTGAAAATLVCYIIICVMSLAALRKYGGLRLGGFMSEAAKIAAGSFFCGAGAAVMYSSVGGGNLNVILSCGFGAAVYFGIVFITGAFTADTVKTLLSD